MSGKIDEDLNKKKNKQPPSRFDRLLPEEEGQPFIRDPKRQNQAKWTIFIFTWMAWILVGAGVGRCSFMKMGDLDAAYSELDNFGLWTVGYYGKDHRFLGCIGYDDYEGFTAMFKTARSFSVFLIVLLTLSVLLITLSVLFVYVYSASRLFYTMFRCTVLGAFLSNLFMFTVFGMDQCGKEIQCPPGGGAMACLVSLFLLLIVITLSFLAPPPPNPSFIPHSRYEEDMKKRPVKKLRRKKKKRPVDPETGLPTVAEDVSESYNDDEYTDNPGEYEDEDSEADPDPSQGAMVPYNNGKHQQFTIGEDEDEENDNNNKSPPPAVTETALVPVYTTTTIKSDKPDEKPTEHRELVPIS